MAAAGIGSFAGHRPPDPHAAVYFQAFGSLTLAYLLLAAGQTIGLLLIPFSSFGLWIQLLALGLFAWRSDLQPVGAIPLAVLIGLVVVAELVRLAVKAIHTPQETRRRLGISGIAGGLAGAAAGVAIPLLGSMFGALLGSAIGTLIGAVTQRSGSTPRRAVAASALAMTLSTATGIVIAIFSLLIVLL